MICNEEVSIYNQPSQNFEAVPQLQVELHLLKVEKLDVCIRPHFHKFY